MVKRLSLIILLMVLFSGHANALGTVVKNNFAVLDENQSARFTILFWSDEEQYVELWVKEAPETWSVIIEPDNFKLNKTTGSEYIALPGISNKLALPVNIYVKPDNIKGKNNVIVVARSGSNSKEIAFIQERSFNLTVEGSYVTIEKKTKNQTSIAENINQPEAYETGEKEEKPGLLYMLIFFVPVIAVIIYKYS